MLCFSVDNVIDSNQTYDKGIPVEAFVQLIRCDF